MEIWQSTLLEQEPHRSRPLHSLIFGYLTIIEPAVAVGKEVRANMWVFLGDVIDEIV